MVSHCCESAAALIKPHLAHQWLEFHTRSSRGRQRDRKPTQNHIFQMFMLQRIFNELFICMLNFNSMNPVRRTHQNTFRASKRSIKSSSQPSFAVNAATVSFSDLISLHRRLVGQRLHLLPGNVDHLAAVVHLCADDFRWPTRS